MPVFTVLGFGRIFNNISANMHYVDKIQSVGNIGGEFIPINLKFEFGERKSN